MGNYFYSGEIVETETEIPRPPVNSPALERKTAATETIATCVAVKEIQQSYQRPTLTKRPPRTQLATNANR